MFETGTVFKFKADCFQNGYGVVVDIEEVKNNLTAFNINCSKLNHILFQYPETYWKYCPYYVISDREALEYLKKCNFKTHYKDFEYGESCIRCKKELKKIKILNEHIRYCPNCLR